MAFTFGNIHVQSKKHILKLENKSEVLLLDRSNKTYSTYKYPITVITDEAYNDIQLKAISNFLESNGVTRYKIITTLRCMITKDEIRSEQKSGLIDFYRTNTASDLMSYVEPGSVIITVGAGLYGLLKSDDIYPNHIHQIIFGKNYFWFSENQDEVGHWVYPIDSFKDLFVYGFRSKPAESFTTNIARFQLKAAASRTNEGPPEDAFIKPELIFIESKEDFNELFYEANKHRQNEILAYDLETSGLDFTRERIGCLSASFDGVVGYYIPWEYVDKRKLNTLLKNNIQLGSNLKFDIKFLWREGIISARVDEDIVSLGHTLDETRSNSLKALAYLYTTFGGYNREIEDYKRKHPKLDNYLDIPEDILSKYAALDAIVTWRVFNNLKKHTLILDSKYKNERGTDWSLYKYYKELKIPAVNMFARAEYRGVHINKEKLLATREKVLNRIEELKALMAEGLEVSAHFDFGSPTALGRLLKERGWEDLGRNKDGSYQVADFQLSKWAKQHPVAKLIQEFRSANVILNTFLGDIEATKGWSKYLRYHEEDSSWRIHTNFNAMGTESGRSRCSEPNLMNIPAHGLFSEEVRSCICTPNDDEYFIVTVDYSGLQLRLAAIDADDDILCPMYKKDANTDIHSLTAYNIFLKNRELPVDVIEVEQDGRHYEFFAGQFVETNRGTIMAGDLIETDVLVV